MNEEKLYVLIEKEFQNSLDLTGLAELDSWKGQNSANMALYKEVRSLLKLTGDFGRGLDPQTDTAWNELALELNLEEDVEEEKVIPMRSKRRGWVTYAVAASVALLVGLISFSLYDQDKEGAAQFFATEHAQTSQLTLADGSVISLNAESRLEVASDFGTDDRRVSLEGEAFFDIARDEAKPFIITVGETETRVLGTSFNVSAYSVEGKIKVSVVSGKVQFTSLKNQSKVILTPNQAGVYDLNSGKIKQTAVLAFNEASWKTGTLTFDKTPLKEAFVDLEKHYDLEFNISSDIGNLPFTSKIDLDKVNETELLELLGETFQVEFFNQNGLVTDVK